MRQVFVSFHHARDQIYKDELDRLNARYDLYDDQSVQIGDIDDEHLDDQQIRRIVRDDYLNESTVTIVLCGLQTRQRKHVDWEIFSSMYDGPVNKQSGILAIRVPPTETDTFTAGHGDVEKKTLYPQYTSWHTCTTAE